ncbi:MAG: WG repeat-containing protein [Bacteroidales bacterium]|nr:WG repeat-containing protein [Bacteroidales bacterium]
MKSKLINKYLWIIETIHRAGKISFNELNQRWLNTGISDGVEIPRRTFGRWRKAIEEIFNIRIENEGFGEYRYYIDNLEELNNMKGIRSHLLDLYRLRNDLTEDSSLRERFRKVLNDIEDEKTLEKTAKDKEEKQTARIKHIQRQLHSERVAKKSSNDIPLVHAEWHRDSNGLWGYVGDDWLIKPQFTAVRDFYKTVAPVCVGEGDNARWGLISIFGRWVVEPKYPLICDFADCGLAAVIVEGTPDNCSYGYFDFYGDMCIKHLHYSIDIVGDYAQLVYQGHPFTKNSYVKGNGYVMCEPTFEEATKFSCGMAAIKTDGLYGYIDTEGKEVIPPSFLIARPFKNISRRGVFAVVSKKCNEYPELIDEYTIDLFGHLKLLDTIKPSRPPKKKNTFGHKKKGTIKKK